MKTYFIGIRNTKFSYNNDYSIENVKNNIEDEVISFVKKNNIDEVYLMYNITEKMCDMPNKEFISYIKHFAQRIYKRSNIN